MAKNRIPKENSINRELAAVILGALMPSMDTTIVAIGISTFMESFHAGETAVQWVSTAYLLALAVAIPATGWAEENYGGKHCWMGGLYIFLIGSVLCALSPILPVLILCRVLQGFGAGFLITLLTSLPVGIARSRGITQTGNIMSTVMLPLSLGPILGPVLGGIVLSVTSWHWLFLINIPCGILAIIFSKKWLGEETDQVKPEQRRPFDFPGFLLLAGSITALLLGMTEISQGKGMFRLDTGGGLLVGIILLIIFLRLPSTRDSGNAIVNIHLLKYRSVAAASAAMFFAGGTLYAAQFLFPLFWQDTLNASALEAAFMLLPQGVGALLTRTAAGRLTDKYGGHIVATGGFLACVVTTAAFLLWGNADHSFWLYGILFARGLAIGMLIVPITTSAFQGLPDLAVPEATVIIRAFQQVGGSFGTAAVAAAVSSAASGSSNASDFTLSIILLMVIAAAGAGCSLLFPSKKG